MVNAIRRTQHIKQIKCAVFWLILRLLLMLMVGLLQRIATIKRINRFRRRAQDTAAIDTAIVRVTTYQAKLDGKPIKPCQKPPNANHKPVKVVIKFEFTIPILINAVKSLQVVFAGLDVSSIVVIVRLFPIQPLLSSKYLLQSLL